MLDADQIAARFGQLCNISNPKYSRIDKAGEIYLALHIGSPNVIYDEARQQLLIEIGSEDPFHGRIFLKLVHPANWLRSQECQLLQRLLTESLTIGKASLESDFHAKAIPFLGGEERRITSATNHVVFGRRGAGKSTLVLHSCFQARQEAHPFAWIALQQYQGRDDLLVIPQVLHEIIDGISTDLATSYPTEHEQLRQIVSKLEDLGAAITYDLIRVTLPVVARCLQPLVQARGRMYIFLDDLHLIHPSIQPSLLAALYAFARGNNIYLKITAIENLTHLYDHPQQLGLQTPGDAQVIRLDYNLVNPGIAHQHIASILDSYVNYIGIPSVRSLVMSPAVLERLTWVCAGVPRDALYIFNNAISKALSTTGRRAVAITDINMAAAESMIEKERYISDDVERGAASIRQVIDDIKAFCLKERKSNAFLVHFSANNPKFQLIHRISDLRFIHILHPGITPERAGEKYEVFLLDYAFYTGFRRTPSVKEVVSTPVTPAVKELRRLPTYNYESRIVD